MKTRSHVLLLACIIVVCVLTFAACNGSDTDVPATEASNTTNANDLNSSAQDEKKPVISFTVENKVVQANSLSSDLFPKSVPEKEGYSFDGWYLDKDNWQIELNSTTLPFFTFSSDTSVYAKFTPKDYKITYVLDEDAKNSNPDSYNIERENLVLSAPSLSGYTFEGWYEGDKKITQISEGSMGDRTIKAKFTPVEYRVTYVLNGGTAPSRNPSAYTIESPDLSLNSPTRAGYDFDGWYDNNGNKVSKIFTGSIGTLKLTAQWKPTKYTIAYNAGTNAENSNPTYYTVESGKLTLSAPTLAGYTFNGWYDGNTKVTEIAAGSTGNRTLTARWKLTPYTITYELDPSATNTNPTYYTVETPKLTLTAPTLNGYSFDGWYDGNTKVTEISEGSTGNRTLTARWNESYTVKFLAGNGSGSMGDKTYTYGKYVNLPLNTFERTDYVFAGWKDAKGNTYANAQEILINPSDGNTLTLTAQWRSGLGFDLSDYQNGINFDSLKAENIGFLILRGGYTGYGTGVSHNKDSSFESFYQQAKERNIPVGVYWYSCANTYEKGWNEAAFLYENCLKGKSFELPIFMDVENTQWQGAGVDEYPGGTVEGVTAAINGFCDYMLSKNMYPAVYTYLSFCPYMDMNEISSKYDIWLAGYISESSLLDRYNYGKFEMWQYTSSYTVNGWSSGIDANHLYKDYETFIKRFGFNGFTATDSNAEFKTYEQLAREVIGGLWGSGDDRRLALTAAGYDAAGVQQAVNWLLS